MSISAEQCEQIKRETFVADIEVFSQLPSTNDRALERAMSHASEKPLLIIAERQNSGRGRGTNRWWSHDGALTFSLLLERISAAAEAQATPLVSLSMGVAVCEAILSVSPELDVGLKWPNDVFVSGRKVAGVLIECPSPASGDLVIGIGLNVNNSMQIAPAEVARAASSLFDETHRKHDLQLVLMHILKHIEDQIVLLRTDHERLRQRWSDLCILQGRRVVVVAGRRQHAGMCKGIDTDGGLIIQTESETLKCTTGVVQSVQ